MIESKRSYEGYEQQKEYQIPLLETFDEKGDLGEDIKDKFAELADKLDLDRSDVSALERWVKCDAQIIRNMLK